MPERRRFLQMIFQGAGASVAGGLAWAYLLEERKAGAAVLRPPGARKESDLLALCTRCGLCIEACPFGALIMAKPGDGYPIGTPYFRMRTAPCRMCRDIPCVSACPTGALDAGSVGSKGEGGGMLLDINRARIGLAVVDRETCIAYWGIQCDACYRSCPLMDRAITVETAVNDRTGRHSILGPVVHADHCTGCGLCEKTCVTSKASIFVLPRTLATGETDRRYIRGWVDKDEDRLLEAPEETRTVTPRSGQSPVDYLNREGI